MSVFVLNEGQGFRVTDKIKMAYASAVTALTPIFVKGIGALVPETSAAASTSNTFIRLGRFLATIANGITIAQFDPVYYVTATGYVTNVDPGLSAGFYLGFAAEAGSAAGTGVDTGPTVMFELVPVLNQAQVKAAAISIAAGTFTATGTGTTETITIPAAISTDIPFASVVSGETSNVTVITAKTIPSGGGYMVLTVQTALGTSAKVAYEVLRAS